MNRRKASRFAQPIPCSLMSSTGMTMISTTRACEPGDPPFSVAALEEPFSSREEATRAHPDRSMMSAGRITPAATRGPASAPRPTSSRPHRAQGRSDVIGERQKEDVNTTRRGAL